MDGFPTGLLIVYFIVLIVMVAAGWKVFEKAGKPGWAFIIPIYNLVILLEIIDKPTWWIIMFLIPLVNLVFSILAYTALAEKFGKGAGFGIGLVFLPFIFFPMLGFGDAQYQGDS